MEAELKIEVHPAEVADIVRSVFETMMSLEVMVSSAAWIPGDDRLTSAIHLAGDWNGAVLLECSRYQACVLAGRFLSIPTPDQVDDDVRDVLGELVNMIGGNLKCILSRGIRLSMPTVVDGRAYALRVCGAESSERLAFQFEEGTFWIGVLTLHHKE